MTNWLPRPVTEIFGDEATVEDAYDLLTVDVPSAAWTTALLTARAELGCSFFDWLSAVDEPGVGFRVSAHVVALHPVRRLLLRTTVPHSEPVLASAVGVYAGAAWHERETHEMFGVDFTDHPGLAPLLLPDGFEGHPLRKDFVLAARVAKAWPGAKEPGESGHGGPKRRQMLPPGVPDPNDWGPQKGQLPPAPARPARGARAGATGATGAAGAAGAADRPARRTRTTSDGSATQPDTPTPRRTRSASEGSVSQPGTTTPRRARSASGGSASQRAEAATHGAGAEQDAAVPPPDAAVSPPDAAGPSAADTSAPPAAEDGADGSAPRRPRGSDAPWHHARPAFAEQAEQNETAPAADEEENEGNEEGDGPRPDNPAGGTPA
ncbi:NADH-quinone oxidoreductase subunit C [Streptomyces sp. O3]